MSSYESPIDINTSLHFVIEQESTERCGTPIVAESKSVRTPTFTDIVNNPGRLPFDSISSGGQTDVSFDTDTDSDMLVDSDETPSAESSPESSTSASFPEIEAEITKILERTDLVRLSRGPVIVSHMGLRDRIRLLLQDPMIQSGSIQRDRVVCKACGKTIKLDKRSDFYGFYWTKHRKTCVVIHPERKGMRGGSLNLKGQGKRRTRAKNMAVAKEQLKAQKRMVVAKTRGFHKTDLEWVDIGHVGRDLPPKWARKVALPNFPHFQGQRPAPCYKY